jgi:DoxX-like family
VIRRPHRSPGRGRSLEGTFLCWIVSFPVLLETAVGIQCDLARIPYVVDILTRLGFPLYFATILGISKILALVALPAPRTPRLKEWAYAGLLFVYVGAGACHLAVGDGLGAIITPLVLAAITLASWALRPLAVPSWTRPLTDQQPAHRGSGLLHRT